MGTYLVKYMYARRTFRRGDAVWRKSREQGRGGRVPMFALRFDLCVKLIGFHGLPVQ